MQDGPDMKAWKRPQPDVGDGGNATTAGRRVVRARVT